MALITRVSRLFRADVNAVLDRLEEPGLLLRQAVREMEEALEREEQRARVIGLELKQIATRRSELDDRLAEIGAELDLCFDTGKEDLARVLLRRKLESERLLQHLARSHEELRSAADELAARIAEHRARLEGMRQKAELFCAAEEGEATGAWAEPELAHRFSVSDDDVELALLREKQKRGRS